MAEGVGLLAALAPSGPPLRVLTPSAAERGWPPQHAMRRKPTWIPCGRYPTHHEGARRISEAERE